MSATRKGDPGFNYSMDKYLDPNRPFKCDVCKESFTQKNILLVHYNSVSHLHRLKKSMQEQGTKHQEPSPNTPEKTPTKGSALEALLGNIRGERKDDDEIKPFKCNICKVAYSQGSTLDIHIRSVLHQTKASKLQELILTGQIDLSKPLIEQPDPQQLQDQHKKMINEMLSPKSLNSTGSTANSQSSPNVRGSSPNRSSPHSSPLANLAPKNTSSPTEGSSSSTDEPNAAAAAAANMSNLAKAFPFLPNLAHLSPPDNGENDKNKQSPVLKNLLQNMGMELVKQFSEKQKQEREDEQRRQDSNGNDDHKPSNLSEVQEALQKAMLQAQLQQMNPMMMQMSQLQGMNPLAAMNIHPPLIPPSLLKGGGGAGNTNEITAALLAQMQSTQQLLAGHQQQMGGLSSLLPGMDPKLLALMAANMQGTQEQQSVPDFVKMLGDKSPKPTMFNPMDGKMRMQAPPPMDPKQFPPPGAFGQMPDPKTLLMQQLPIPNMIDQGKRARTRITDDQLKILRSYFDINNSPGEEQLTSMAGQTGLPMKVIKHWFRNTLFKERQKNKDSPYNFSNPPSTKLNMEEYEKSGESKVTPLNFEEQEEYVNDEKVKKEMEKVGNAEKKSSSLSPALKSEPVKSESPEANAQNNSYSEDSNATTTNKVPTTLNESSSESSLTLPRLLSSQLSQLPHPASLLPNFPAFPNCSSPLPPTSQMPDYLTTLARGLGGGNPQLPMPPCGANDSQRSLSPSSVGGSGKRANRTRFTDYQIKVLQEFFENNAYPKDDDLEYLSKLLSLSPRVIVVWFQNARQKARKIYENQPPADPTDEESGRFTRTAGCNYQCKKCLLVFQRYYELIRHQKQHCYKEEDAKRSALAQKAAGAAAAQFGGQPPALMPISEDSNSSADHRSITSPAMPPDHLDQRSNSEKIADDKRPELSEMTKDAVNRMFGGNQFAAAAAAGLNYPPNSQFGLLHQQALQQQLQQQQQQNQSHNESDGDQLDAESLASSSPSSPSNKRKLSDDGEFDEDGTGHQDKRLRTSILPEQLDFLGRKYSEESNPSRKMLEQIAGEVGLRKKVVQVWFQNARARERKGQSPLTKDDCTAAVATAAGSAAVAAAAAAASDRPALPESPFAVSDQIASLIPNSASAYNLQDSMRKYYEDTMKRFMNDINNANNSNALQQPNNNGLAAVADNNTSASSQHHLQQSKNESAAALDLTSNFDDSFDHMEDSDMANKSVTGDADCALGGNIGNGGIGSGGSNSSANKRFRTQMSGVQVKMMKGIFEVYKTPTMSECSNLGQEIGLQKRVVQVWFQNARAKEKRAKLQLQQATGSQEEVVSPSPDSCKVCIDFHYGHKNAVQDHLFTRSHLDNLRVALEQGRYDPESPGVAMTQTANALLQQQNGGAPVQSRNSSTDGSTSLPTMLQMPSPQVNSRELLEIASHQNSRMLMQV
jgi:AT-binding transcription factor 1